MNEQILFNEQHLQPNIQFGLSVSPHAGSNRVELIAAAQRDMERLKTVLVVDDEKHISKIIEKKVASDLINVHSANNGVVALMTLKKYMPDLIILDMKMPKMNGYEFLGRLKGNPDWVDIPVIILTGYDIDMDKMDSIGYAPLEVLHKSGGFGDIVEMVKEFL